MRKAGKDEEQKEKKLFMSTSGLILYLYSPCRQDTKVQDTTTAAAVKYNDVFGRQRFQIRLVLFLFWDTQPPMKTLIQFRPLQCNNGNNNNVAKDCMNGSGAGQSQSTFI